MSVNLQAPERPRQAVVLQQKNGKIIAGGTLVVADLNYGKIGADTLVTLDQLGLDTIKIAGSKVTLGATVTMAQIARDARLAFLHPVACTIGGPAVRAMATVGGNLFAPSPYGDMAAAFLALDATVVLAQGAATKTLPIEDFLRLRAKLVNAVVLSISFSRPPEGSFRFIKAIRRRPVSAAVVTIAALVPQKRGRIAGARIAYGAVAPTAIRARAVETALEGKVLDEETIATVANVAAEGTAPQDDAYASAWYRRAVLPVYLRRLLAA
jgi:CO/xanthine dehydrogenase FAD-binding subunit